MRPLRLFGKNLAYAALSVLVWLVIGYAAGSILGAIREPAAARFVNTRTGAIATSGLERYYAVVDGTMLFCAWCGLITSQVVFAADLLGFGNRSTAPGGFPVQEA